MSTRFNELDLSDNEMDGDYEYEHEEDEDVIEEDEDEYTDANEEDGTSPRQIAQGMCSL